MMSDSDWDASQSEQLTSGDEGEYGFGHEELSSTKAPYTIYSDVELRERQQRSLNQITSVLSVGSGEALRLLCEYKWDVNRVQEEWFSNNDAVREKVGLIDDLAGAVTPGARKLKCGICFDLFDRGSIITCAPGCCHSFCKDCWRQYIHTNIGGGQAVLNLRCPDPSCCAAVPATVFREVSGGEQMAKLDQFALQAFVQDSRSLTWCPAPGCEHAVESNVDVGSDPLDIACKCGASFCFQCKEEAHRPVSCSTVKTWLIKNSAESENLNWILAHTKQCPKCKRPIEKNQGCMHMTCSQCRNEFCWLCLGSWAEHGERTGGFYACNRFESAEKAGEYDEESRRREQAKNALERYMHYYQRWAENDKARGKAQERAREASDSQLHRLSELTATPTSQLKFISDAWGQVVDCRRILKWTYTYGYYTFGEHADKGGVGRIPSALLKQYQDFFEFNQGQAEAYLEQLHSLVENKLKELERHMEDAIPHPHSRGGQTVNTLINAPEWPEFRQTLIGLVDVTRSHFHKLVEELEKGMQSMMASYNVKEVVPMEAPEPAAKPTPARQQAATGKRSRAPRGERRGGHRGASPEAAPSQPDSDLEAEAGYWQCVACTFANRDLTAQRCEVCDAQRQQRR